MDAYDVSDSDTEEEMVLTVDYGIPPIAGCVNLYDGGAPYVPVAVHDIEEYFNEDEWRNCIRTIRTVGIVHRVGEDSYELGTINEFEGAMRFPLSRGTSRELKSWPSYRFSIALAKRAEAKAKKEKKKKKKVENPDGGPSTVRPELPIPDEFNDPVRYARAVDGVPYIVLGKLCWVNSKIFIDVDKFIRIRSLSSTYELFLLQSRMARRNVEYYRAHHDEIGELVRRTY